jgi:hypothetical protein
MKIVPSAPAYNIADRAGLHITLPERYRPRQLHPQARRTPVYVGLSGVQVDDKTFPSCAGRSISGRTGRGRVLSITIPVSLLDEGAYKFARHAHVTKMELPAVDGLSLGLDLMLHEPIAGNEEDPILGPCFRRQHRDGARGNVVEAEVVVVKQGRRIRTVVVVVVASSLVGSGRRCAR